MRKLPYFCWYPADVELNDDWRDMDFAGRGFYMTCLNYAWKNGGLPVDPDRRARALQATRAIADRLWKQVERCFIPDPEKSSMLVNERQEEERAKAMERHLRGIKGVEAKRLKAAQAVLKQNLSSSKTSEQVSPRAYDSDSDSSEVVKTQEANFELSDYFEKLYAAHPKKTGRILAEQALVAVVSDSIAPQAVMRRIAEAHQAQLPELSRDAGRWCPQLHKWLSDRKYMDDAPEPPQTLEERIASL